MIKPNGIASRLLGSIHCSVSPLENLVLAGFHGRFGVIRFQFADDHHKLVAAETRDGIHFAYTAFWSIRCCYRKQVADRMAVPVVQRLEVVKVKKYRGAMAAIAFSLRHGLDHAVDEQAAVPVHSCRIWPWRLGAASGSARGPRRGGRGQPEAAPRHRRKPCLPGCLRCPCFIGHWRKGQRAKRRAASRRHRLSAQSRALRPDSTAWHESRNVALARRCPVTPR